MFEQLDWEEVVALELQLPVHGGPIGTLLFSLSRCYAIHTAWLSIRPPSTTTTTTPEGRRMQRLAV